MSNRRAGFGGTNPTALHATIGNAVLCVRCRRLRRSRRRPAIWVAARYVMGTVAAHAVKRWQTTGGVISSAVTPVAYPDERYRTVLMWWDRETFADLTVAEQLPFVLEESAQIAHAWLPTPSIPGVVVCS